MTTESFRKDIGRKLTDLQASEDEDAKVEFPTKLTSTDRKYVHKIAESFKLHTVSSGVGDGRMVTVYKNLPEGTEAKRPPTERGGNATLSLAPDVAEQLRSISSTAPPSTGRVILANVRCTARNPLGSRHVRNVGNVEAAPVEELMVGSACQGYWPDDDTWLDARLVEIYEDGSFRIAWAEDGSESDMPTEYVRAVEMEVDESVEQVHAPDTVQKLVPMSIPGMEQQLDARKTKPGYEKIRERREELPGYKERVAIMETIRDNQVCLLVGETGCGKSTQVPQLILDACPKAKVLCMQPRKLAATTLADRIAVERCERVGESVGYVVPFGCKGHKSRLVFATLGVFRKRMIEDTELSGITHVVFDEVHERDKLADFNMIFVRDLLERRPDLRVVLMSATLQMETFENYFPKAAKIHIPGRVYPVNRLYMDEVAATLWKQPMFRKWLGPGILCGGIEIAAGAEGEWNEKAWKTIVFRHTKPDDHETMWGLREKGLEDDMMSPMTRTRLADGLRKHDVLQQSGLAFDYPIIEALILHIDRMHKQQQKDSEEQKPQGTILIFLPGWGDIEQLQRRLGQNFDTKRFKILPLHSQVTAEQQEQIFKPAELGTRKIVLTTNIAEASITVEGTEFVIDSGRAKEVSYDPYLKVGTLNTSWISQASAKQRAGRAGRTQGGLCFHLFCRDRYDNIDEYLQPELLRSPLEDSALTAKMMLLQMGSTEKVSSFLGKAPSPPEALAISNSIGLLVELGAFTEKEELTALGEHLTKSPLPPRLAKTVLWAILLGVLDDALTVVCAGGGFVRDPFRLAGMEREEAQQLKRKLCPGHNSDHICLLMAVNGFVDSSNQQAFCDKWKLHFPAMKQIKDQQNRLFTELQENKTESFANRNRGNHRLLIAVLNAGIFPNVARRRGGSDFYDAQSGKVEARPHGNSAYVPQGPDEWVFFQELSQVESSYKLKSVSPVEPLPLLLLGGEGRLEINSGSKGAKEGKGDGSSVSLLDGWVKFQTDPETATQIQKLRASLHDGFQSFCQNPGNIPPTRTLMLFDKVAAMLGGGSTVGCNPGKGIKRQASWQAGPLAQRPKMSFPSKGGRPMSPGGKGKGGFKGVVVPTCKGMLKGGGGKKGGFKGGKW